MFDRHIFSECFAEEFVDGDERKNRSLNPNRKSHRENFAEKCDQMLDIINVEKELHEVNFNFSRTKIKQLDADATNVLQKATKHVECRIIRT